MSCSWCVLTRTAVATGATGVPARHRGSGGGRGLRRPRCTGAGAREGGLGRKKGKEGLGKGGGREKGEGGREGGRGEIGGRAYLFEGGEEVGRVELHVHDGGAVVVLTLLLRVVVPSLHGAEWWWVGMGTGTVEVEETRPRPGPVELGHRGEGRL